MVKLGTLTRAEPDYGLSSRAVERASENDPRYIRITDFGEDGVELGHEYVTADPIDLDYRLYEDDLLFARSGATVGKTYLHEDTTETTIFAGYCIRFQFDTSKVSPRFVYWWTKTEAYSRWVESTQRPSGQPNINKKEFESCPIPLPPILEQNRLVSAVDAARAERKKKLAEADALLTGLDDYVLDALGIGAPTEGSKPAFAVKKADMTQVELSPSRYLPELRTFLNRLRSHPSVSYPLAAYVDVNPQVDLAGLDNQEIVGFIPMAAVSDGATGDYAYEERPLGEVRKGYTPFMDGDILWAKITPCMQNGKSCIVGGLPSGVGFGSTEFHVLRVRDGKISAEFVKEFVSQKRLRQAATNVFTGSAGQQRVPAEFLENLPFPELPKNLQVEIVEEVAGIRAKARRLRAEAEAGWQEAKRWFEEQLLGDANTAH